MTGIARVFAGVALGILAVYTTLAGLFAAGYAVEDANWQWMWGAAVYLVVLVGLTVLAARWPQPALWVLGGLTVAFVAAVLLVDFMGGGLQQTVRDLGPGPYFGILMLGVPLGVLGLKHPEVAGGLLVLIAAAVYGAFLLSVRDEPWQGISASLTTSSTIGVVPVLVAGVLDLVAGVLPGHRAEPPAPTPVQPPLPTGSAV